MYIYIYMYVCTRIQRHTSDILYTQFQITIHRLNHLLTFIDNSTCLSANTQKGKQLNDRTGKRTNEQTSKQTHTHRFTHVHIHICMYTGIHTHTYTYKLAYMHTLLSTYT